ncbi:hypothetical protein T4D_15025 [Trichinella pseudospiralis]|uniref:Uncharacterized protein n=1 Tax=Trichinella pseudospiralis TaxID=6337 RepID=A0A0V1FNP2_TRIPS|nr:hypothetical protein T4D_15025 [Trichinella pseudospiralis]
MLALWHASMAWHHCFPVPSIVTNRTSDIGFQKWYTFSSGVSMYNSVNMYVVELRKQVCKLRIVFRCCLALKRKRDLINLKTES